NPALVLLAAAGLPAILANGRATRIQAEAVTATAADQRLGTHLFQLATSPAAGKEVRIYGLAGELSARADRHGRRLASRRLRGSAQQAWLSLFGAAINSVAILAAMALVAFGPEPAGRRVGDLALCMTLGLQVSAIVGRVLGQATNISQS